MGKDPKTQERIYKDVLLPVSFIGEYSDRNGAPAKKGAAPVRGAAKPAAKPAAAEEEAAEIDLPVALRKKLTGLAQSATAKEFTKAAAKDKDVLALPDDTMSHVINPGPSGFWQSVQE